MVFRELRLHSMVFSMLFNSTAEHRRARVSTADPVLVLRVLFHGITSKDPAQRSNKPTFSSSPYEHFKYHVQEHWHFGYCIVMGGTY